MLTNFEKKIFYDSTDNIKLCGVLNKIIDDKIIVILCHGFYSNKDRSTSTISKYLNNSGINTFKFDFRAQGESSGIDLEMTIKGQVEDLESTINLLTNKGYEEFILLGGSFGGGIVSLLDYNKFNNIKGLILWYATIDYDIIGSDSSFSLENKRIAKEFGFVETKNSKEEIFRVSKEVYKEREVLKPYENIETLDIPILFVHGTKDASVPYTLSERVYKNCKNAKLITIENGEHTFMDSELSMQKALEETIQFINEIGGKL